MDLTAVIVPLLLAAPIQIAESKGPPVELRRDRAVVTDDAGRPLFAASAAYLFARAGNPERLAFAYDPGNSRVRISPDGAATALWLSCAEVTTSRGVCDGLNAVQFLGLGAPSDMRDLPDCPGDRRCPP